LIGGDRIAGGNYVKELLMRTLWGFVCSLVLTAAIFAQGDRGTITGTVVDPAGAVVAGASMEAKNAQTGAVYTTQTTATGNYTLSQLPAGNYEISVNLAGFKKYTRQGLEVGVAQTVRIDVSLEVGSATESVTVTEAAPLLKTESGELSHNVTTQRLDELPVLGIGAAAGSSSIRNPTAAVLLIPGAYLDPNVNLKVNGSPANTASYRVEGQDASNGYVPGRPQQVQPSVDSIQEVAIQTSNFSAEYGQVGGGFFNYTMKSGTNQLHGTAYDYFVNEALNAGTPFTVGPKGHLRPIERRNDYGFTVGGPVYLPKIYNGHDKTFFFFNLEQFREFKTINNQSITVPIQAYRDGDFQRAMTGRTLATDPIGRPILEGAIYDPSTQRLAPNGATIRDPYTNNTIPVGKMDPVALKVQGLIPLPNVLPNALTNNAIFPYVSDRVTGVPSFKIDHNLSANDHLSFYFSRIYTASQYSNTTGGADGLPEPITGAIGTFINSHVYRLNFEHTLTPTLLLHLGAGYQDSYFSDNVVILNYDSQKQLGLKGQTVVRMFPAFQNASNAQGGVKNLGPNGNRNIWYQKPTGNASMTWVKDNHTYKFGSEVRFEGVPTYLYTATNGVYSFNAAESGLPSTQGQNLSGGIVGAPYASFLMGLVDSGNIAYPPIARVGQSAWGFFGQDTWKVSRKFTLDYGLRYDYQGYPREQYGRYANFSATTPNPSADNRPGAVIFEGDGPGHCNCSFAKIYPWAFGPRLGAAYQINGKTVLRAGWGIVYSSTPTNNQTTTSLSTPSPFTSPAFGQPAMLLRTGIPITPAPWPNLDPGQYPLPGTTTAPKMAADQNAGRPARQVQWSIGVQREILPNLVVEASYVGNRGVWWTAPGLIDVNAVTPDRIGSFGLDINNAADRTLLASRIDSTVAAQRGFNDLPYSSFPTGSTVAQSLRPFPQFGTITSLWSPLGKTWYDSLQTKVTKRFSRGLTFTSVFTWQKQLVLGPDISPTAATTGGEPTNDVFNRANNKDLSSFDQPFLFNTSVNYTIPAFKFGNKVGGKVLSWGVRDWSIGIFMQYGSGFPIQAPAAQNALASLLFRGTFANRVPGQPLFTQDLNCHCFDPNKEFVLNPKAWSQPAAGQWGTSAPYYTDYRFQRRPIENLALGRTFRITERVNVNIRAEFTNVLNRVRLQDPVVANALATQTQNNGRPTAGFGWINTTFGSGAVSATQLPRSGTVVARLTF